ncbi:Hsp70/Hsp90 co-chaperone CNS1 [Elsinoe australis]|uniref:Hsp70/Hsp90 co-chaperone CNS1 n=1 Tax=Elsinoe australis TaxID=40998 RepID=A0A4U7APK2_9PEZI|nr:Hsp70/Hsp90 co-chaperone CNS1 [Elsinoe australis]
MASSRIEELPDDFEENATLSDIPPKLSKSSQDAAIPSLENMLSQPEAFANRSHSNSGEAGAAMPPAMKEMKQQTVDEVLDEMNRIPLFMTNLDNVDGPDGGNIQLEALRAMAYEGTRAEIAGNFREQGNEAAKQKLWKDAREFYDRALHSLRMSDDELQKAKGGEGPSEFEVLDVDEEEDKKKERQIQEASLVNRALCNLEMSTAALTDELMLHALLLLILSAENYGACNRDCAAVLKLNSKNVKAWYRSATACLALDKVPEAEDACSRGLEFDPSNAALKTLSTKIAARKKYLEDLRDARRKREERERKEQEALKVALKARNITTRTTTKAPDMEDATISLTDPLDPASILRIPTVLLYPLHAQSDFIKRFADIENLAMHLEYILPLPWDEKREYTLDSVECYVETVSGGLVKTGKNMELHRILGSGKVEVVDGLLKINVVPKAKAKLWIEKFKEQKGR